VYSKYLIILIFFLSPLTFFGQKENDIWYFGALAGLDFTSGSPLPLLNSGASTVNSTSSIADSLGHFRFLSNGSVVWNKNFEYMTNGIGLFGNSNNSQPVISIKSLTDDSLYYLFTVDHNYYPAPTQSHGLTYSVLNLRLNGGKGDITQKNIALSNALDVFDVVTATRHKDNKRAWVVGRKQSNSKYYISYLFDSTGISS